MNADRHLLLGILALQNNFIDRHQLVAAFDRWTVDKGRPLAEILLHERMLSRDERDLLESLVERHLGRHNGDPQKSLAAVSLAAPARDELRRIVDTDVEASVGHLGLPAADDDDLTRAMTAGMRTAELGRFRVLRPHSEGGLGKIFVARDEELHREVALKEIQERHADDPESRARFVLEAEVTGALEHPGIVPVYGLGAHADGRPYYAMRLIRGDRLKEAIARFHGRSEEKGERKKEKETGERAVEFRKLLTRFLDVCNAIDYAHSRGVLHRDLKPANIMLGAYGETLVVDWGLAKHTGCRESKPAGAQATLPAPAASGCSPTQSGVAVGTPGFMSPEQAEGRLDELGPASDVFSLGATLYAILTGGPGRPGGAHTRPLEAAGSERARVQSLHRAPRALDAICEKAMAPRPADRYHSARALADDVEHWLADEPVAALREPRLARLGRWGRRHKPLVAGAVALLATAVVALSVSTLLIAREQGQTERRRLQAVEARRLAEQQSRLAEERFVLAQETLSEQIFDVQEKLSSRPSTQALRVDLLKSAQKRLAALVESGRRSPVTDNSMIWSHLNLGEVYRLLGKTKQALEETERALALAQAAVEAASQGSGHSPTANPKRDLSVAYERLGDIHLKLGDSVSAGKAYQQRLETAQELAVAEPTKPQAQRDLWLAYLKQGELQLKLANVTAARQAEERSLEIAERRCQADPRDAQAQRDLSLSYERLGDVYLQCGRLEDARSACQRRLEMGQRLAESHPDDQQAQRDLSVAFRKLALVRSREGNAAAARDALRQCLEIRQRLAQADFDAQYGLSVAYEELGEAELELGDAQAAREACQRSLEIAERLTRGDPENAEFQRKLFVAYSKLAHTNLELGDRLAAVEACRQGLQVARHLAEADAGDAQAQRDLWLAHHRLGDLNRSSGDLTTARDDYRQCLRIAEGLAQNDSQDARAQRDLAISQERLGDVYLELGELPAARAACRESLEIKQRLAQADPRNAEAQRDLAIAFGKFADVEVRLGDFPAVRAALRQALEIGERLAEVASENAQAQRDLSIAHDRAGNAYSQMGDPAAARESFQRSLVIRQRLAQADPENARAQRDLSISYEGVGHSWLQQGDPAAAREPLQQSLAIRERLLEADADNASAQRDVLVALQALGSASLLAGDVRAARDAAERSLRISGRLAGGQPENSQAQRDWSISYQNLANACLQAGELEAAREACQECLDIRERLATAAPDDLQAQTDLLNVLSQVGSVEQRAAEFAAAVEWFERAQGVVRALETAGKLAEQPQWKQRQTELGQRVEWCQACRRAIDDEEFAPAQAAEKAHPLLLIRASVLAQRGRCDEAAAAAEKLAGLDVKNGIYLYDAACGFALTAAAAGSEKPSEALGDEQRAARDRYAARAVELLKQAVAAGFFSEAAQVAHLRQDHDLDSLRERDDFKELVAQLERE